MSRLPALPRQLAAMIVAVLVLTGGLVASAHAEYGGLGHLGNLLPVKEGEKAGNEHVQPGGTHGFVVNPKDGSFFIADTVHESGKTLFRVQEFSSTGAFEHTMSVEAETSKSGQPFADEIGGLAIDTAKERIYLMALEERPVENELVRKKIEKLEVELEKAEKEKNEAKAKEDKEKIAKEEERVEAFDNGRQAASAIYAFGTKALEPAPGTTEGLLVSRKALKPDYESETGDAVPLLEPRGITVDPKTHDLLIAAEEDVAKSKPEAAELETLRAVIQRVHPESPEKTRLGARYIDNEDCLEEAHPVAGEPRCAESAGSQPSSPIALPNGHVLVEQEQQLWEIPDQEGISEGVANTEAVKSFDALPKRMYALAGLGQVINFDHEAAEEGGDQVEFAETSAGHGRIYLSALVEGIYPAVLELSYAEGAVPAITELGWTGGQSEAGANPQCHINFGPTNVLAGGDAVAGEEDALVFTASASHVNVMRFGPGGESCGHAEAGVPVMTVKGTPEEAVEAEEPVNFTSKVTGANALSTTWRFKNKTTGIEEAPATTGFQGETAQLEGHEFKEGGTYEVTAEVQPDDFGPAVVRHTTITVTGKSVSASLESFSSVTAGTPLSFKATVADPFETPAHINYKIEYGDGTKAEAAAPGNPFTVEHTYAATGEYHVKLSVTDAKSHSGTTEEVVKVTEPTGNIEVHLKSPTSVHTGSPATVTAAIVDPLEGSPHGKYRLNFGDGGAVSEGSWTGGELHAEHAYAKPGTYEIQLEAEDASGHKATEHGSIEVVETVEQKIVVKLRTPARLLEGEPLHASATIEDPFETTPSITFKCGFGDGTVEEGHGGREIHCREHAYAKAGTYTVTVEVEDAGKEKASQQANVIVLAPESGGETTSNGGGGGTTTTTTTTTASTSTGHPSGTGAGGVLSYVADVTSSSIPVTSTGGVPVKVACASAGGVCTGEIVVRTLSAVKAARRPRGSRSRRAILTLASGHFVVAAGQTQTVMLHLSSRARSLLAHAHVLKARATVKTRQPGEAVKTTERVLTLRLAAKGRRKH